MSDDEDRTAGLHPRVLAFVALGGLLGALSRDALGQAIDVAPATLPTATLVANLAGAALLGVAHPTVLARRPRWRPFLAVGLLGAFTTFSGLAVELIDLARDDAWSVAGTYLVVTVAGGVTLAALGLRVGTVLVARRSR